MTPTLTQTAICRVSGRATAIAATVNLHRFFNNIFSKNYKLCRFYKLKYLKAAQSYGYFILYANTGHISHPDAN